MRESYLSDMSLIIDKTSVHTIRCGEITLIDGDIIHVRYLKGIKIVLQDIMEVQEVRIKLIEKKHFYTILDGSEGKVTATNEARAWMSINKESAELRIMDVMLVSGIPMRLKVSSYLRMYKPAVPTKIVTSFDKALAFINEDKLKRGQLS